jgi:hypothetical protein
LVATFNGISRRRASDALRRPPPRVRPALKLIRAFPDFDFANTGSDVLPGNAKLAHDLLAKGLKDWGDYVKLARIEPLS